MTKEEGIGIQQGGVVCLDAGHRRDRDQELTDLFLNHYDPLRRLAYVILGDASLAEEITMEAFAKALSKWRLVRSRRPSPCVRASDRGQPVSFEDTEEDRRAEVRRPVRAGSRRGDAERLEDRGINIDVWNAVRRLPERQRTCIVLRYLEDLSEPDIAAVLNVPVGTVKSQLSRGRKKLAETLGGDVLEVEP